VALRDDTDPIILLGEWCGPRTRRNCEVLPYHWDDRARLERDFRYLEGVYERYLDALTILLNGVHRCDYPIKYWRILIGPWLRHFIEILFDRHLSIECAAHSGLVTHSWIGEINCANWIPRDFSTFSQFSFSDEWNHVIYDAIIRRRSDIPFEINGSLPLTPRPSSLPKAPPWQNLLHWLRVACVRLVPDSLNRIVFVTGDFSRLDLIKLQLSLGQVPYLSAPRIKPADYPASMILRHDINLSAGSNSFERLLDELIPVQIPTAYVEGFGNLRELALAAFPRMPDAIFTANAFSADEGFKVWAAECVSRGTKLLIGQHGGGYGCWRWTQLEDHEVAIADRFYTWGWSRKEVDRVKPMPSPKLCRVKNALTARPRGDILCVLMAMPRYSHYLYSGPLASQVLSYINDQIAFARNISVPARELLRIRPYQHDYGWNVKSRLAEARLDTLIDTQGNNFISRLQECRLCVYTYNSTGYLETLAANYPTLLFWNPNHWEIRPDAQPYFDDLRRVGILYDTPEAASAKVNEIYRDPQQWWRQPLVQAAKDRFCARFARTRKDWLQEWKTELLQLTDHR